MDGCRRFQFKNQRVRISNHQILSNARQTGVLENLTFHYVCIPKAKQFLSTLRCYIFYPMLAEVNYCLDQTLEAKRSRVFPNELQASMSAPRKRQTKAIREEENPYQVIPQIPHIKLSEEDMRGDPIQLFIKLQQKYIEFGAVKVTVSDEWKCPFQERFVDKGITTRIQYLSKLKHGKAFEQNVEAYSFQSYQAYALNFEKNYKYKTQPRGQTLESKKEDEYWSLVTKPQCFFQNNLDEKSNVKVEYAADLASTKYGSGFPVHFNPRNIDTTFVYETNLFNLNNLMNSPLSVLGMSNQRKEKVSGITHPWVYMGSLFSTFCWHVEDLWVNSLNFNHKGGTKTWYIIPASHKQQFDAYVKNKYCLNSHKQTLLDRITFMVDPLELLKIGIPVYKAYQRPRDYICTFFKAYHCGFSQGYNIGEAVNFLSPLSISVMQQADRAKNNCPKKTPNVIPIDWIIYQNYIRINKFKVFCQKIKEAYKEMIQIQKKQMYEVKQKYSVRKIIVFPETKKYDKIYCSECKEYLYLRAFRVNEKKAYCFQHLRKQEPDGCKIQLQIRRPNNDRKYIIDLFGKSLVEEQIETDRRGKTKSREYKSAPKRTG